MDDTFFVGWIVPYCITIPLFFAMLYYRRFRAVDKIVFYYLIASIISSIGGYILRHTIKNNLPLLHIYTIAEFIILIEFFKKAINDKIVTKYLFILQTVFTLFCIANTFLWQGLYIYNSYSRSFAALLIMVLAVNFYARLFTLPPGKKITQMPEFWFNSGIFLYFSGAFVLFIFSNFVLIAERSMNLLLWNIHAVFVLIMYIMLTIGFSKIKQS